jgi:hypothetical protein
MGCRPAIFLPDILGDSAARARLIQTARGLENFVWVGGTNVHFAT